MEHCHDENDMHFPYKLLFKPLEISPRSDTIWKAPYMYVQNVVAHLCLDVISGARVNVQTSGPIEQDLCSTGAIIHALMCVI